MLQKIHSYTMHLFFPCHTIDSISKQSDSWMFQLQMTCAHQLNTSTFESQTADVFITFRFGPKTVEGLILLAAHKQSIWTKWEARGFHNLVSPSYFGWSYTSLQPCDVLLSIGWRCQAELLLLLLPPDSTAVQTPTNDKWGKRISFKNITLDIKAKANN